MRGIDISHWQGIIDFVKVKHDDKKIEFVVIKASQFTISKETGSVLRFFDANLHRNAIDARSVGLMVSYYHFADTRCSAEEQAIYFLQTIKSLPTNDFPLALDIETNEGNLNAVDLEMWINRFIVTVQSTNKKCGIYSYTPFLNKLSPNHKLGNIPLFLASYTEKPTLPHGWVGYYLWQYSDKGKVDGINGNVDLDTIAIL